MPSHAVGSLWVISGLQKTWCGARTGGALGNATERQRNREAAATELRKAADYGKERLVLLRRFPLEQALGLPSIIGKFSVLRVMRIRVRQLLERSMASAE